MVGGGGPRGEEGLMPLEVGRTKEEEEANTRGVRRKVGERGSKHQTQWGFVYGGCELSDSSVAKIICRAT